MPRIKGLKKEEIFGKIIDSEGRCVHYASPLDIIANRCAQCKKLYACYKCHDEAENHPFSAVKADEEKSVMCGVCGRYFSYKEYSRLSTCPECSSAFNPRCALHCSIYAKES